MRRFILFRPVLTPPPFASDTSSDGDVNIGQSSILRIEAEYVKLLPISC